MISSKSPEEVRRKIVSEKNLKTTKKNSKTSFGRHLDVFIIFFLSWHLEEFPTNRHLENFRMLNNWIPLKKHRHLEDFIDQEVTSLFIIELEDIGNFLKN